MASENSGSEDVNDFLQRIKELGDRRDQEDEERNRKLEEEILKGRKERQARRSERARSISPTKSSPANTPNASKVSLALPTTPSRALSPTNDSHPRSALEQDTAIDNAMERLTALQLSPSKENYSPGHREKSADSDFRRSNISRASPSSVMPSRSSPFQRRPTSRGSDHAKSRPLSMVATENAAGSPKAVQTAEILPSAGGSTLSRDQIARSLANKDPAWFRQTADRGLSSPAYRRNQVEDEERSDHAQSSSRVQMPGMSRESSIGEIPVSDPADRTSSPSRKSTVFGGSSKSSYQVSPAASGRIGSPLPLSSAQRLDPPSHDGISEPRNLAMSPSQGRISPERIDRPLSPTKGMGGFVQSAMMKRSDSVNKRWSVQSPTGLNRVNSVASNRSNHDAGVNIQSSTAISRPENTSRGSSPRPSSRPTSSHSNATFTQESTTTAHVDSNSPIIDSDGFVKPALPLSRSQTPPVVKPLEDVPSTVNAGSRVEATPPSSPSKTMDPRRWSPTKSSWLESALNKPDSPKPKVVAPPQQPSWMAEIAKAKQKSSVDLGRSPGAGIKHEVNIGGLMRSPPMGSATKPPGIGSLSSSLLPAPLVKTRTGNNTAPAKQDSPPKNATAEEPSGVIPIRSPPSTPKVKPETPPKKDFRASLKPRQPPPDNGGASEPEFKNVFGQLRRTTTQNYVAPDVLKSNITRGKAALNITGGPKKTERVDEFKDAILKKKDDFKKAQTEGKGIRPASGTIKNDALPEALARRKTLVKSDEGPPKIDLHNNTFSKDRQQSPKPIISSRDVSGSSNAEGKESLGGKLAGRFNPALAGLLARGPPSMASDTSRSSSPANSISQRTVSMSTSNTYVQEPGPQLTHMTKSRARGPRRKAPTSVPTTPSPPTAPNNTVGASEGNSKSLHTRASFPGNTTPTEISKATKMTDVNTSVSQPSSPRKLDMKRRSQFLQDAPNDSMKMDKVNTQLGSPQPLSPTKKVIPDNHPPRINVKPLDPPEKSESLRSTPIKPQALTAPKSPIDFSPPEASHRFLPPGSTTPGTGIPSSSSSDNPSQKAVESHTVTISPVSKVTSLWEANARKMPPQEQSARVPSPIKLPTQDDEKAAMVSAGLRPASPAKSTAPAECNSQPKAFVRPLPVPPKKSVHPPRPLANLSPSMTSPKLDGSAPQSSEAFSLIEFFHEQTPSRKYAADTVSILSSRVNDQNTSIKTLRSTQYRMMGDGKKQLVPSHQERILFEGELCLCNHTFVDRTGKKMTEVYFWIGDDVPRHVAADCEGYARKEANNIGATLVVIKQGKETSAFFHALGGIIIIRRGTSNRFDSLAPSILCARKHFGHIVFDEVDFFQNSLCSGFPFLISTGMKAYLWKGKGSSIEELSCARLIGMEFGITGEIEEVDDGNETASFLDIFGGAVIPKSADHWRLKLQYPKYGSRLFRADASSREQITEISPFCQSDVSPSSIYVLDAFFEIYIIIGARAQSQYGAFHHALTFVQEYGIFAASMEDRPFVPVSTVVVEGVPRDMKSVFRSWREELTPTTVQKAGLQRGRSLRVIPLNAAIEATR